MWNKFSKCKRARHERKCSLACLSYSWNLVLLLSFISGIFWEVCVCVCSGKYNGTNLHSLRILLQMAVSEGRNAGKTLIWSRQVRIWNCNATAATRSANTPFVFRFSLIFFFFPHQQLILETLIATRCPAPIVNLISTESVASLDQLGLGMLGRQESL